MIKYEETKHPYYCNEQNYYNNNAMYYATFEDFDLNWGLDTLDIDLNYIFRFDIIKKDDNKYLSLNLYFMQQRKGIFLPVIIDKIKEKDMEKITTLLKKHYDYTNQLWSECYNGEPHVK